MTRSERLIRKNIVANMQQRAIRESRAELHRMISGQASKSDVDKQVLEIETLIAEARRS